MTEIKLENKKINIFTGTGMNGQGVSRRVFITVDNIQEVPAALFAVKVSQSQKPEKAGKTVFKQLLFKQPGENQPWQDFAPQGVTLATPVEEIKNALVSFVQNNGVQLEYELAINLNGKFGRISTPAGAFTLYDEEEFAATNGQPPYYLNRDTVATVTLKEAQSKYGSTYFQVDLSTASQPDEIFTRAGRAKVWGEDESVSSASTPTVTEIPTAPATDAAAGGLW